MMVIPARCSILHFLSFCTFILLIAPNTFAVSPGASAPAGDPLNPPKMVRDVCKNTTNYRSCLGILLGDPRTKSLSTKTRLEQRVIVARVAFRLASSLVIDTTRFIVRNLTKDNTIRDDKLDECRLMYEYIGTDVEWAAAVVGEWDPTKLDGLPRHDCSFLRDCENQYQPPQSSPLYGRNRHMRLLLEIANAITLVPV